MKLSSYIVVLIFISLTSCSLSKVSPKDPHTNTVSRWGNDNWRDTLECSRKEVKESWLKFTRGDWDYLKRVHEIYLTEEDIPGLEFIPVEIYVIDSISFANLNIETSIENILKLKTDVAHYYVVKDKEFIANVDSKLESEHWRAYAYGGIAPALAPKLSELYFSKKNHTILVGVHMSSRQKNLLDMKKYNVFIEDGKFMSVDVFGHIYPFIDELLEYRDYLDSVR